ncbi:MAG: hypothetical protein Q8S71_05930 [Hydrogenophaga sp.]|nr:hypothetical protein [Hydrogenophaga sp.]
MTKNLDAKNAAPLADREAARKAWHANLPRYVEGSLSAPLGDPVRQRAPHADNLGSGIDLSLADAQAVCGQLVSARGLNRWPLLLTIGDAVSLQRPCQADDESGRNRQRALGYALAVVCDLGQLASSRAVIQVEVRDRRTRKLEGVEDDVMHHITAADFVVWLALQHETPSEHVLAWVRGSAAAQQPATWEQVAAGRRAKSGAKWSDDEKRIARIEFQQRGGWRKAADGAWKKNSEVAARMVAECGMTSRPALDRVLGNAPDDGGSVIGNMAGSLAKTTTK